MAGARYWRAVGLSAYGGGDAELSALQLYEGGGDPDYNKVSLLLHCDGANGSAVIADSSSRTKSVQSRNGAIISTSQSKFDASLYSGNIIGGNVVFPTNADFDMGAQDFTVEFWVYMVALHNSGNLENFLVQHRTGTGYWGFSAWVERTTGLPVFSVCNTSTTIFEARSAEALPVAQWVHFAGTRSGNTLRLFINGNVASSIAISGTVFGPTDPLVLFGTSNADTRFKFNGYIDDLHITKGVARYTANFTPPTEPFPNSVVVSTPVRVDQSAVLTSTLPPISGTVSSLHDDSTATNVRFSVREPGFALQWDFGPGVEKYIALAAPGAAADSALFLSHFDLQSSNDGKSWVQEAVLGRYPWPGENAIATPLSGNLPLLAQTPVAVPEVAASISVPSHSVRTAARLKLARDVEFGGRGTIYGTTKTKGTPNLPTKARVVLQHQRSRLPVRETWSDPVTGAFVFTGIDTSQQFLALAEDAEGHFRPVAANRLTPEVV